MSRIGRMRRSRFLASSIGVTCAAALALPAALPATASAVTPTDSSSTVTRALARPSTPTRPLALA
ncbi:N-acetylmuramoyl-L-alanine amidase, partial [Streptomyces caniscabiei]|nr:N-acetylmuramoyl-L-alanine amidase [Streptomyces caniscabiei]